MANNKHLTLDDHTLIEVRLKEKTSFSKIAKELRKDPRTISKEIRLHLLVQRIGGININYNACAHQFECTRHFSDSLFIPHRNISFVNIVYSFSSFKNVSKL